MVTLTCLAIVLWIYIPHEQNIAALKYFQLVQTVCTFLIPPFIIARIYDSHPTHWLNLHIAPTWQSVTVAVLLIMAAAPAINLLTYINQQMILPDWLKSLETWMMEQEENAAELTLQFVHADSIWGLLVNIGLMAILPAFAEELSFRAVLQHILSTPTTRHASRALPHAAIWATAIIFSAIHMQFYGFIPRMLLGAILGYTLYWSGTLWLPIIMHMTNNTIAVISYYVAERKGIDPDSLNIFGVGDTLWLGIASLCIVSILIYLLRSLTIKSASSRISRGS